MYKRTRNKKENELVYVPVTRMRKTKATTKELFISLVISDHRGKRGSSNNCLFLESPILHFIEKYFTGEIKGCGNLIIKGRHNGSRNRSVE